MDLAVVFDTNILLSALLSLQGSPFRCLALAKQGIVQSITCEEILYKVAAKLQAKFKYTPEQTKVAVAEVRAISRMVSITGMLQAVAADPADDKIVPTRWRVLLPRAARQHCGASRQQRRA